MDKIKQISNEDIKLASFGERIGAAIFDFLTLSVLSGYLSLLTLTYNSSKFLVIDMSKMNYYNMSDNLLIQNAPLLIANIYLMFFFFLFWYFNNGSTIGQKAFNVRVVNKLNQNMSITQTSFRAFIYTIFYNIPITHIISIIMIFFKKDRLSLHDKIVSSKVIRINNDIKSKIIPTMYRGYILVFFVIIQLFFLMYFITFYQNNHYENSYTGKKFKESELYIDNE